MSFGLQKYRKIIILSALAVILLGLLIMLWQTDDQPNGADRIYTNVYIHGVAVGGMTGVEAEAMLMERFQTGLNARVVQYFFNGEVTAEYTFADFEARFDFSALVEDALEYSHMRSLPRRIARMFRHEYEITENPIFIFNAERMEDIMLRLSETLDTPMQNATFFMDSASERIEITPEIVGHGVNIEAAAQATREILSSLTDGTVELEDIIIAPLYTTEDFNFTPAVLGYFATPCSSAGDESRRGNIILAAERINNSVIYPGETFSAGTIIAAHLPNSGYGTAIVLVNGEPAEDVGGGVCQVVTTLYNAVLHAELEIIQRFNHSARVSYVDIGFDATVAGDYYDLKFKNNTSRPLLITSLVENEQLHVRILGCETRESNRSLRFEVRLVEILMPGQYREIVDPEIPSGVRYVTLEAQMGYHVELYKHIYINGVEVAQEKINTSVYRPLQGVIAIGAG